MLVILSWVALWDYQTCFTLFIHISIPRVFISISCIWWSNTKPWSIYNPKFFTLFEGLILLSWKRVVVLSGILDISCLLPTNMHWVFCFFFFTLDHFYEVHHGFTYGGFNFFLQVDLDPLLAHCGEIVCRLHIVKVCNS